MERRSFLKGVLSTVFGTVVPGSSALGRVANVVSNVASGGVLKATENIIQQKFGAYIKAYLDSGISEDEITWFIEALLEGSNAQILNSERVIDGLKPILPEFLVGFDALYVSSKKFNVLDFLHGVGDYISEHENVNKFTGGVLDKLYNYVFKSIDSIDLFSKALSKEIKSIEEYGETNCIKSLLNLKRKNLIDVPLSVEELEELSNSPLKIIKIAKKEGVINREQANKIERKFRKIKTGDEEGKNLPDEFQQHIDNRFGKIDRNLELDRDWYKKNHNYDYLLDYKPSIVSQQELNQEQPVDLDKEQELDDFEGNPAFQRRFMKVESKSRRDF